MKPANEAQLSELPADRDRCAPASRAQTVGSTGVAKVRDRDAVGNDSIEVEFLAIEIDRRTVDQRT